MENIEEQKENNEQQTENNEEKMEKYLRLMCFGSDKTKESIEREIRRIMAKEEDIKGIQLIILAPGMSEQRKEEINTLKDVFPRCAIYWGVLENNKNNENNDKVEKE